MSFLEIWGVGAFVIWVLMTLLWLLSLHLKDASIVDIFWGLGFVILAYTYNIFVENGNNTRQLLLLVIVTLWGIRLGAYIFWRNRGHGEDYRYAKWRENNGKRWWWQSYFQVFILQGVLMVIISAPLLAAQYYDPSINILDGIAIILWLIGFAFEAGGDLQLARFKANPANKGKVLDKGFWRYTRHPNYFGDATQWWAYYLLALASGAWWTIFSPILMTLFLLRVSGVALLEKSLVKTKPQYADYIERTSAFFPLPPKKKNKKTS
ncbi:MAG: hypothetical protein CUN55_07480 [Phototrophicales bacterium]|nr:MAG: hypothetical protein CUN55_07480 [Phototrophicales bacterium]